MYLINILVTNIGPLASLRLMPKFLHPAVEPPLPRAVLQPGQPVPILDAYDGPRYVNAEDIENQRPLQKPQPILLVGSNGSGKSTVVSIIADAIIELARQAFQDATNRDETGGSLFLRPIGSTVAAHGASFYFTAAQFRDGIDDGHFLESFGLSKSNFNDAVERIFAGPVLHDWIASRLPMETPISIQPGRKEVAFSQEAAIRAFGSAIAAYFPASRFEDPIWLQGHAVERRRNPKRRQSLQGKIPQSVFTETALDETLIWIERLLADSRLPVREEPTGSDRFVVIPGYSHELVVRSVQLKEIVERILQLVTGDAAAELMHTPRGAQELYVIVKGRSIPITALSTGEIGLLVIFVSLLMRSEIGGQIATPDRAAGICLIDEIDSHLHVNHQINVVPELIAMFPQVQFIITAHSPLVGLGIANRLGPDGVMIVSLPNGELVDPERNDEFRALFEAIGETSAFQSEIVAATSALRHQGRPVVFLEGQTDRDYLELAAAQLSRSEVLEMVELRIGVNGASGDGAVSKVIDNARHLQGAGLLARPTLGLCDFDRKSDGSPRPFVEFEENHVWKKQIPPPIDGHWWGHGIETLIDMPVPTDLITESSKIGPGGAPFKVPELSKVMLCERLKENPHQAGFAAFAPIFDLIERFCISNNVHSPAEALSAE